MKSRSPPDNEHWTRKQYYEKYPKSKARLSGTTLEKFVSWVAIEQQDGGGVETFFMINSRVYRKACDADVAKSNRETRLRTVVNDLADARTKNLALRNQNRQLTKEAEQLAPVKDALARLHSDHQEARALVEQLKNLVSTLQHRAGG